MGTDHQTTAAEALQAWRDAERVAIRSTAQREATEQAIDAAQLAEEAARATATSAAAAAKAAATAATAATEASRTAGATSDTALKVLQSIRTEGDAQRIREQEALAAEEAAKAAHRDAVDRTAERYRRQDEA